MAYRKEHVDKLRDVAADYTALQDLGLQDSPSGRKLKARFEALRRNASPEEWVIARDAGRISDIWR